MEKEKHISCSTHCCQIHGCKYSYDDCPVATKEIEGMTGQCEMCGLEEEGYYDGYGGDYIEGLEEDNDRLRKEVEQLQGERSRLRKEVEQLKQQLLGLGPKPLKEFIHQTIKCRYGDGIKIEILIDELREAVKSKKIDPLPFYVEPNHKGPFCRHCDELIDLVKELGYQTLHYSGGCFIHLVHPPVSNI